jgi:hypothetical protein
MSNIRRESDSDDTSDSMGVKRRYGKWEHLVCRCHDELVGVRGI